MTTKLFLLSVALAGTSAMVVNQMPVTPPAASLRSTAAAVQHHEPIYGVVAPSTLGNCSAAVHDRYVVDGGDGYRYRTWHPQVDFSGCVFAHEHGDDPDSLLNAEIRSQPVMFGYIGRRMQMPGHPHGHDEPHEGFKVFVANPGDVNDEDRVNRVFSRSVFHMGTGGAARFNMRFHSADIRLIHPEFGLKAFTRLMMDTGGTAPTCDPRQAGPSKDAVTLNSPCLLDSSYEIWTALADVRFQGRVVYRALATPAVFDPITVFNPGNPDELVYAWDPRADASYRWKGQDRTWHRGCDRESYAQPGYWYNGRTGRTTFHTDVLGSEVPASDPLAIVQTISASNRVGAPATTDGLLQFKVRRSRCQNEDRLGLRN